MFHVRCIVTSGYLNLFHLPDVAYYSSYIESQALAVLKRACSLYPYECRTGKSLQSESREVSALLVQLLQEKADVAGVRIVSFELADLQYAPEIAPGMLVRQQAQALIEARNSTSLTLEATPDSIVISDICTLFLLFSLVCCCPAQLW